MSAHFYGIAVQQCVSVYNRGVHFLIEVSYCDHTRPEKQLERANE